MKNIKHNYKNLVKYFNNLINSLISLKRYFQSFIKKKLINYQNKIKSNLFNDSKSKINIFNSFIKKKLINYKNKIKNNFFNDSKSKISNFNKLLITVISLLFIYLFYLLIPTLYDKSWVQNTLENKLLNEFKTNFSFSSDISYEILPSPHFTIKNAKMLNDDKNKPKELAEIKKLEIFITQKNFFDKENFKIKKIMIKNANFSINKDDFDYINNFIVKKLSHKKIAIKKGKIFYRNYANEIISLTKILNLSLFYDHEKAFNVLNLKGEIFKLPFFLEINNEISKTGNKFIKIKSKKIKLQVVNNSKKNSDETIEGLNTFSVFNSKFNTSYNYKDNLLKFNSSKSLSSNYNINYSGKLSFKPFDLVIDAKLKNLKIGKMINADSVYTEIFKNNILFNKNISAKISINSIENNNKLFDFAKIVLNVNNGKINFNQTGFFNERIGQLKIVDSNLFLQNNDLILNSKIVIDLKNSSKFYSLLQTPKKSRTPLSKIEINLDYSLHNDKIIINKVKFNDIKPGQNFQNLISIFNNQEVNNYKNFIKNKNLFNKLIEAYSG
jgi:hypothetical protein